MFCELRPMETRKVVVLGAVVLPTSVIVAFAVGLRECLTVGEFFLIDDVMHREAFELTVVAFCSGVFLGTLGFAVLNHGQVAQPPGYWIMVSPNCSIGYRWLFAHHRNPWLNRGDARGTPTILG